MITDVNNLLLTCHKYNLKSEFNYSLLYLQLINQNDCSHNVHKHKNVMSRQIRYWCYFSYSYSFDRYAIMKLHVRHLRSDFDILNDTLIYFGWIWLGKCDTLQHFKSQFKVFTFHWTVSAAAGNWIMLSGFSMRAKMQKTALIKWKTIWMVLDINSNIMKIRYTYPTMTNFTVIAEHRLQT